jgi:hypothetical protein
MDFYRSVQPLTHYLVLGLRALKIADTYNDEKAFRFKLK